MSKSIIVVGVQWGDEGKGKVIDLLAEKADYIVRSQGGNNAGHAIIANGNEFKFHLIPSGVLYPKAICLITGGVVIDLSVLVKEIQDLSNNGISLKNRLKISSFAHLIMPYHKIFDRLYESQKGENAIGTTGKGIGPCYSDKALRVGFQIADLLDEKRFKDKLNNVLAIKNNELQKIFNENLLNFDQIYKEFSGYAKYIKEFVYSNVEQELADAIDDNKKVLFEGAHGTFLDNTFGTYPYVTSSSTVAAGVAAGAGIGPTRIDHVVGVVKAYTTRVGNGPLPSALSEEDKQHFLDNISAREVGTTTGRNRRLAWFDAPLVKQAIKLNGVDSMAIMKLDVLDNLPIIKICVGYTYNGKKIETLPADADEWVNLEPIYEVLPGWQKNTTSIKKVEELPEHAINYLSRIEELCDCPISLISLGPDREKTIVIQDLME